MRGVIVSWDSKRGFGLVKSLYDGEAILVHKNAITTPGYVSLDEDMVIEYQLGVSPKGLPCAANVEVV